MNTFEHMYISAPRGTPYTVDSVLMDTSVKWTPRVGHSFLSSLYLTLYKTDIALTPTASAGLKGVRLRESWL